MSPAGLFTIARVVPAAVLAVAGASKLRRHHHEEDARDDLFHAPAGEDLVQLHRKELRRLVQEGSSLDDVVLRRASLRGADLCGASLTSARLLEADLGGADLRGADLSGVQNLAMARLHGARADAATVWPGSFDAAAAGVRRVDR